jgi:hypothetical protein
MAGAEPMLYSPKDTQILFTWARVALAFNQMSMAAAEVILRRSLQIAQGSMSQREAVGMVMEKATTFAVSAEKAALAAAQGADPARIAHAALKPIGTKTRSNVRRLRR